MENEESGEEAGTASVDCLSGKNRWRDSVLRAVWVARRNKLELQAEGRKDVL